MYMRTELDSIIPLYFMRIDVSSSMLLIVTSLQAETLMQHLLLATLTDYEVVGGIV